MKSRRGRKDGRKQGRKYIQITWPLVKQGVPKNFNAQWFIIARGPCIVYLHYSASTSYVDYSLSLSLIPSLFIDSIEIALIPIWGVRRDAGYRCHFPSCTCENFLAFLQAHHLTMGTNFADRDERVTFCKIYRRTWNPIPYRFLSTPSLLEISGPSRRAVVKIFGFQYWKYHFTVRSKILNKQCDYANQTSNVSV